MNNKNEQPLFTPLGFLVTGLLIYILLFVVIKLIQSYNFLGLNIFIADTKINLYYISFILSCLFLGACLKKIFIKMLYLKSLSLSTIFRNKIINLRDLIMSLVSIVILILSFYIFDINHIVHIAFLFIFFVIGVVL